MLYSLGRDDLRLLEHLKKVNYILFLFVFFIYDSRYKENRQINIFCCFQSRMLEIIKIINIGDTKI